MVAAKERIAVWWLLPALIVVAWFACQLWNARSVVITLPLVNKTEEAVALEFYGPGVSQPVQVEMAPLSQRVIELTLTEHATLRFRVATARLQNDAVLLDDSRSLQAAPQQFEIRPGGEFVLVAAD